MQSMTGYGRAMVAQDGREMTIEVKSVNHRYLDISLRTPRVLAFMEDTMRRQIGSKLTRGHVDVFVHYRNTRADAATVRLDTALALRYQEAMRELADALGQPCEIPLAEYARLPDVFSVETSEDDQQAISELTQTTLAQALDSAVSMREAEGTSIFGDMQGKLLEMQRLVDQIAELAPQVADALGQRLQARMAALLGDELPPERLAMEVAIISDRACVDEELVRLRTHLVAFEALPTEQQNGRKMDFLIQECNREANTIGSKANDVGVSALVIALKSEIEKLREQAQNLV